VEGVVSNHDPYSDYLDSRFYRTGEEGTNVTTDFWLLELKSRMREGFHKAERGGLSERLAKRDGASIDRSSVKK
jgi:hypothetical protein